MIYFLLWMILPVVLSSSYALDIPEGIYWGHEWQLGYYKHPPFSSWVLYSFYKIFGYSGPYILSQMCIALTLVFVYLLGSKIVSKPKALYAAIFVLAIYYYTWPSIEFNHNVAQMPIWAGLIYIFYLILNHNRWSLWLIFGVVAGIGMLTKYTVVFLIFSIVLFSLLTPYRHLWLSAKPWVATLLALLVFSPHLWWLYQHDWLTFNYIQSRSESTDHHYNPLVAFKYLAAQVSNFLPLLIILLCNKSLYLNFNYLNKNDRNFLFFMGLFPGILLFIISLIAGINIKDMWASPMWSLVALILFSLIPESVFNQRQRGLIKGLWIWLSLITLVMASYLQFGGQIRHKPSRLDWPQQQISQKVQQQWYTMSQCPLDNITGDNWLAILAATKMDQMPSVMMSTSKSYSPWMTLSRLEQKGTFVLWEKGKKPEIPYLSELQKNQNLVIQQGEWSIAWDKVPNKAPLVIEWQAFIPKHCTQS
ncbi:MULTISPECIES: glycosyltransferase family 39 protein [unclassified Acinetobacter]|uniref:glycosyltransferase family 39 protein n=1 Tax=unclassified Acinetobacter TaxID=196816 RepID=UPI00293421BC|nr:MULTISPECIES: glycosyltransferase family 39 protein [unclassified Acinetobacter]WOE30411.1 glycosyltransferase family 39 protein [Acinetobacter sp. SAAs470]WOE38602.1 glycosyltransferase family 39 protein [Acinetobacter sp. SAAs474]